MSRRPPLDPALTTVPLESLPSPSEGPTRLVSYFVVQAGLGVGAVHLLNGETLLGRDNTAGIRILDDGVSRFHARAALERDQVTLVDAGSTNGTYVNGSRLTAATPLQEGDTITLGSKTVLKYRCSDLVEYEFHCGLFTRARGDALTGTWKRAYFDENLSAEFAYARRHDTPLAVLLLDIDHFKTINDSWGHPVGDLVLSALARRVQATLRSEDVFARYGGEEFAVLCRGISDSDAFAVATRLCDRVGREPFALPGLPHPLPITISVGVSTYPQPAINTTTQLVAAADHGLYAAKRSGRNTVRIGRGTP